MEVKRPLEAPPVEIKPSAELNVGTEGVLRRKRRRRRVDFQAQRERRRIKWELTLMLVFIAVGWAVLYFVLNNLSR